jgi:hypothetical protein
MQTEPELQMEERNRGVMRRRWTEIEDRVMREFYPQLRAQDLAEVLKRPVGSIYQRADKLGLSKSAEFLASDKSGRVARGKLHPNMVASQFKPGQQTWNKGLKGSTGLHDNCRATQFKKGRPASEARNYRPIGSVRINADGYLERKITDDPAVVPARRWVAVSRLVWEAAHGPIPAGRLVRFKPGLATVKEDEITINRLECITRGEHANRNHPRNRSPELARLVQLKGAITRQVNRIAREAQEQA